MINLKKKGFTIIELVIVIAVIAVLAAVLIPTFSSLVKKANESVDIQLVRQLNTTLKADEIINGKPETIEDVRDVLEADGYENPVPVKSNSFFAWDSEKNVIVLVDKETNKGVFPEEYKGLEYTASWILLAGTVNIDMEDLGNTLEDAINNAELGQTIVLSSDQTLNSSDLPQNVNIDLGGYKLTLTNGISMDAHENVIISNGDVESAQITTATGATLVLNDVNLKSTGSLAIYPHGHAPRLDINGGSIIANTAIDTAYTNQDCRDIIVNINGTQIGSDEKPCEIGIGMITSGSINILDSTIYATKKGLVARCGNIYIENTVINYSPENDFVDTHLSEGGYAAHHQTPTTVKSFFWAGSTDSVDAPIVIGDFHAKHYSFDANCTLVDVKINSTNDTYPDVYLSQENYDLLLNGSADVIPGTEEIVKTTLTCDTTIKWMVNPGKTPYITDEFEAAAVGRLAHFISPKYSGFEFSGSGHNGTTLLYIDNVFVNGVEQAKGSTSANPVPAN